MSRSRKKAPFVGITTATSEKIDKQIANRCDRKTNAAILKIHRDDSLLRDRKETSNVWDFGKDSKIRINSITSIDFEKLLRK